MSIYNQSVSAGTDALSNLLTGSSVSGDAAYDAAYAAAAKRAQARRSMGVAQQNITALRMDKITSNVAIQLQRDQMIARSKLNAAAAGVSGDTLQEDKYALERDAVFNKVQVDRSTDQQIEQQLGALGSSFSTLITTEDPKISYVGDLLGFASSFELSDLVISEALSSQKESSVGSNTAKANSTSAGYGFGARP